jgi:hypothetical protein
MPSLKDPKTTVNPDAGKLAVGTKGVTGSGTSGGAAAVVPGGNNGEVQVNSNSTFGGSSVTYDGTTFVFPTTLRMKNGANFGTLSWSPSASRSLVLPDASDTVVCRATTDTLTNKTINGANNTITIRLANDVTGILPPTNGGTGASSVPGSDTQLLMNAAGVYGSAANVRYVSNKLQLSSNLQFLAGGIKGDFAWVPTSSDKTLTFPDLTDNVVTRTSTDSLSNKTLTSPALAGTPNYTAVSVTATGHARFKIYSDISSVQTTDATQTNLFTWTLTDECSTTVHAEIQGIKSDGTKTASFVRRMRIKRDGGSVTLGSLQDMSTDKEAGFDVLVTIDNSTATGRIRVTGLAATTIDWGAVITRQEMTHA